MTAPEAHDAHFAAYSFVDRIDGWEPARRARGHYAIPAQLTEFPACLVAEAVGQLAAWLSMDAINFRGRPVAGLATETRFLGEATPGRTLTLEVELSSCDDEAVAYGGRASVEGAPVAELVDCLGPMMPAAEFDDPSALRERLALLRGEGATPGRFPGVPALPVQRVAHVAGEKVEARLEVPDDAPFFHDHFPRRPVFPATLLLDAQIRLALGLAAEAPWMDGRRPRPMRVTHVKMRSWIVPGQRLDLAVEQAPPKDGVARATMSARADGKVVASARLEIAAPDGAR